MAEYLPDLCLLLNTTGLVLFNPAVCDSVRGIARVPQQRLSNRFIARRVIIIELAHVSVVSFDAHTFDTFSVGCGGTLVHDQLACPFDITRQCLVEEVNVEPAGYVGEEAVDVLKRLVVGLQSLYQMRRRLHELLRHNDTTDVLQQQTPFGNVRTVVRCS